MMCSMLESAAYNIRDTDDLLNPVGAGCLTGVIYKITSVRQPRAPQRLGIRFQPPSAYRILEVGARPVCSSVRLTACALLLRAREWRCPRGSAWELWLLQGLLCPSRSHLAVC